MSQMPASCSVVPSPVLGRTPATALARSGSPDADIDSGECPGHGRPGESLVDQPGFEADPFVVPE